MRRRRYGWIDFGSQNPYCGGMEMAPLTVAAYLEWEQDDYREAVEGIRQGYADFQAGRTQSVDEAFEEVRVKHGLPG
jgi:hypothetical protein